MPGNCEGCVWKCFVASFQAYKSIGTRFSPLQEASSVLRFINSRHHFLWQWPEWPWLFLDGKNIATASRCHDFCEMLFFLSVWMNKSAVEAVLKVWGLWVFGFQHWISRRKTVEIQWGKFWKWDTEAHVSPICGCYINEYLWMNEDVIEFTLSFSRYSLKIVYIMMIIIWMYILKVRHDWWANPIGFRDYFRECRWIS